MKVSPILVSAVIFDMDGVLTRTTPLHARAWKRLFDEYLGRRRPEGEAQAPFDPVRDYLDHVDGKPRYDGVRDFLAARGIEIPYGQPADGRDVESCCGLGNRKDGYFEALVAEEGVEVFDTTVARLRELRAGGVRTALVTSSRHGHEILERTGLATLFDVALDGNAARARGLRGKPCPDLFLEAARLLGTEPSRTAVVEDAVSGVQAARAGGFALVVAVDRGANREGLRRTAPDLLVQDLGELPAACLVNPSHRASSS
jgi:beta-phosphoglucomutase family hydrolase